MSRSLMCRVVAGVLLVTAACGAPPTHEVSSDEAGALAVTFVRALDPEHGLRSVQEARALMAAKRAEPLAHVVTFKEGGFALISADDRAEPVLAYSPTSDFPAVDRRALPPALNDWLEHVETYVAERRVTLDEVTLQHWANLREGRLGELRVLQPTSAEALTAASPPSADVSTKPGISRSALIDDTETTPGGGSPPPWCQATTTRLELPLTTTWGQGWPYNSALPGAPGQCAHFLTGCVATAVAQLMAYYKYPRWYDWDGASGSWWVGSNRVSFSIANVMADVGRGARMNYGCFSSGAYSNDAASHLRSIGYGATNIQPFTFAAMVAEHAGGRPVYHEGFDFPNATGHAFLSVGWEQTQTWDVSTCSILQRAKINWGWDGGYNGYFASFTVLGYSFTSNLGMLKNVVPQPPPPSSPPCGRSGPGYGIRPGCL